MVRFPRLRSLAWWLAFLLILGVGLPAAQAQPKGKAKSKGKGKERERPPDPRMQQLVGDLRALFNYWDEDRNNSLDAAELARGFRGEKATPYQPDPKDKDAPAGTEEKSPGVKDKPKPRLKFEEMRRKYPDYDFLMHWDQDRNDKVSADEFTEFRNQVLGHYRVLFRKVDDIERFQTELAKEGLQEGQKKQLRAQMIILRQGLAKDMAGFKHQLHLNAMAASSARNRADWAWYKLVNSRR
jgi:hypothetical protein